MALMFQHPQEEDIGRSSLPVGAGGGEGREEAAQASTILSTTTAIPSVSSQQHHCAPRATAVDRHHAPLRHDRASPKALDTFLSPETKDGRGGWKKRLRDRCMDRIKTSRDRILQDIRGISPGSSSVMTATTPFKSPQPPSISSLFISSAAAPSPYYTPGGEGGGEDAERRRRRELAVMSRAAMSILDEEINEGERGTVMMMVTTTTTTDDGGHGVEGSSTPQQQQGGSGGGGGEGSAMMDVEGGGEVLSSEEYMELMQAIEEALQQEMRSAEERWQCEEYYRMAQEMDEGAAMLLYDGEDHQYQAAAPTWASGGVAVLCPCCKRNYLWQDEAGGGSIVCGCGLHIEATSKGGGGVLCLSELRDQLADTYAKHRRGGCMSPEPCFFVHTEFGSSGLWATCEQCGYHDMVTTTNNNT